MKKILYALAGFIMLWCAFSCNSSDYPESTSASSQAQITAFYMSAEDSIFINMDSVFFSIDQLNLTIFNADSLPAGTRISALTPHITAPNAKVVELHVPRPGKSDTIYNFLEKATDTIDFSNGPVRVRIVAQDGIATSVYSISVNVHKMPIDTLVWSRMERASLPSRFQVVTRQHTTMRGDDVCCLTYYSDQYCLAVSQQPDATWKYITPSFGFTPDMDSFSGTEDALFILDTDGNLYTSTDGEKWSATGQKWHYIYGNYDNMLLGSKFDGGRWWQVRYPADRDAVALPANFPVSGTSAPVNFTPEMAVRPQMVITGGRLADGSLTRSTWAYDGVTWAKISRKELPYALENITVVPYFVVKTAKNTWRTSKRSALFAMCGNRADGTPNDTMYISRDFGMNWEKADSLLQMPSSIPSRTRAQAYVVSSTLTDRNHSRAMTWTPVSGATSVATPITPGITTLATKPIDEWECPYIYLFGGVNKNGTTYNTVYRAVITNLTFKPLQ